MCYWAIAEIAASVEMSCVTIVLLLLRGAGCKLSFANSLSYWSWLCGCRGLANPQRVQLGTWRLGRWNPACCRNTGCWLVLARWASPLKHLWLLVATGWIYVSARDTAGGLTPVFQSCVVAPLLPEGLSLLSIAAIMSADKLQCFVWTIQ